MAYLIYTHTNRLLLINNSAKHGLYSQTLSSSGLSRPLNIHRNNTVCYSAAVDHHNHLHIVTQPSPEQIMHLHYKDNSITRNIILEDPKGIYDFSNLYVTACKGHVHLLYTANQPLGDACDLIHHILCQESKTETRPIMSFSPTHLGFRYISHKGNIYVLYGDVISEYTLSLMIYKDNKWEPAHSVSTSSFPIDDFQLCIDHEDTIHMVYVQEKYGRYHLLYKNNQNNTWGNEVLLHTTSSSIKPSIFTYHQGLWITYVDENQLQMILSMNSGNQFSKHVPSSMQNENLERCNFVSAPNTLPHSFNANVLYASLTSTIRIAIISHIDMIHLHPDLKPNTELELFLDGIFHTQPPTPAASLPLPDLSADITALEEENNELKQTQEQMVEQYNEMAELTRKIQEEGKKWRNKALALEQTKNQDPST